MKLKFICTEHPDYDKIIVEQDWRHYAGGIYLHGNVESANHYDGVELIDYSELESYNETDSFGTTITRSKYPTGIFDVEVYGYKNSCKAFIWSHKIGTHIQYHGLIVDINDKDAMNYANTKFNEKSMCI